jgi:hypothetical protein
MFEHWAETIGGILDVVGIPGFLGNLDDFYQESDTEGAAWRSFILTWWERFQDREVQVAELWESIKDDVMLPILADTEQAQKIRLGKLLSDKRDRTFSVEFQDKPILLRITRGGQKKRAYLWKLGECGECGEFSTGRALRTHAHAPARTHAGGTAENTRQHSPDSPPADCPHSDVEKAPTHDGYVNRICRTCGKNLGCRKAEPVA